MALDFSPSREKIKRAKFKLSQINNIIHDWSERNYFDFGFRVFGDRAHYIVRCGSFTGIEIAWEFVEGVGHLRSCLDKMIVAIVVSNGKGLSNAKFPFGGVDAFGEVLAFPSQSHGRLKNKLSDNQWQKLLAEKPYPGGDDILFSINSVANFDKHMKDLVKTKLAIVPNSMEITGLDIVGNGTDIGICLGGDPEYVSDNENETVLFSYAHKAGMKFPHPKIELSYAVLVTCVDEAIDNEIINLFQRQIEVVENLIEKFE